MNTTEFQTLLETNPDKPIHFVLPNGKSIPPQYHITEVGHVKKDFIDCGGTVRSASACLLQAWVADDDGDHRLLAGKLDTILKMAGKILPREELDVEIEYEAPIISQFSITQGGVSADAIVFKLANKHTDCLAKESCGLKGAPCGCSEEDVSQTVLTGEKTKESCCGTEAKSGCC